MNALAARFGLFCISGALLSYEFVLMRLLSLAYWGHFAALVFSVAMLGLAAAGLFLHCFRARIRAAPARFFSCAAAMFGFAAPCAFLVSQLIPFTPYLLAWSPREYGFLLLRIALFFVPFFLAGIAVGIPFTVQFLPASRLYRWSMLGSATPMIPLLLGLDAVHPVRLMPVVSALGLVAAWLACRSRVARMACVAVGAAGCLTGATMPFHYSEFKALPKTLLLPESRVIEERFDWQGTLHVVSSPHTRYFPGLSLNFPGTLPRSDLVFVDASAMEVVFDPKESLANPEFLRLSPEALSYEMAPRPRVLLLNAGSVEILRALAYQASSIVAVDELHERLRTIHDLWDKYGNSPLRLTNAGAVPDEPRRFLRTTQEKFDLILLPLLASHASATAGAASLDPNFVVTREGLSAVLERLSSNGHAVFTTWVENPPRTGVKLAALIIDVLRRRNSPAPARHILALRSWSTLTFYVAASPFPEEAIKRLKSFAERNSFDLVYYPGIAPGEANQFNVIPDEPYFAAFQSLLGPDETEFRQRWPFHLRSATDHAPFFSHHFRWAAVSELVRRMGTQWVPFVEWGYMLLVASLAAAALLGFSFLIVPCLATRMRPSPTVFLFLLLGFAYMFVEMWAVYRLLNLIGHPAVTFAVTLTFMLAGSGAGAAVLVRKGASIRAVMVILGLLLAVVSLFCLLFSPVLSLFSRQPLFVRALVGGLWMAVPAFFMGFPFPFALEQRVRAEEIPWALGLNGLGSVLGSLMATLLAVHFGLNALAGAAVVLYLFVAAMFLSARPHRG
ncbi:MAG: hypothetical protein HYY23_07765 [Verrucomicrobia bacterium]|nr:hypothetical protein [Verrucomicrobiota bacterium]